MRNLEYVLAVGLVILFTLSGSGQVTASLCKVLDQSDEAPGFFGYIIRPDAPSCPGVNNTAKQTECCLGSYAVEAHCCESDHLFQLWIFLGVCAGVLCIGVVVLLSCVFCDGCYLYKQRNHGRSRQSPNRRITVTSTTAGAAMAGGGGGGGGGSFPMQEYNTTYPAQHTQMQMQAAYPPTAAAVDPTADSDYPTKPGTEYPASPSARPLMQAQHPYPEQAFTQGPYPMQAVAQGPYPGQAAPQGAYPMHASPHGAYPMQAAGQGAYPMQAACQGTYPAQAAGQGAYPAQAAGQGAYPAQPAVQQPYPGQASPQGAYPMQATGQGAYPTQAASGAAYPPNQAAAGLPPSYNDVVTR